MDNNLYTSRSERQMKRRRNERFLFSSIAIAVLFVFMLVFFIFKGNNDAKVADGGENDTNDSTELVETDSDVNSKEPVKDATTEIDETDSNSNSTNFSTDDFSDDIVIQSIESSDENVIEAFVGNWSPMGTTQEEPHTVNYDQESQDWLERREALLYVTKINEDDLIEHWHGNGGEQKVIAVIEDKPSGDLYRIYLSWIENEGWQPTLVELIKEYVKP